MSQITCVACDKTIKSNRPTYTGDGWWYANNTRRKGWLCPGCVTDEEFADPLATCVNCGVDAQETVAGWKETEFGAYCPGCHEAETAFQENLKNDGVESGMGMEFLHQILEPDDK